MNWEKVESCNYNSSNSGSLVIFLVDVVSSRNLIVWSEGILTWCSDVIILYPIHLLTWKGDNLWPISIARITHIVRIFLQISIDQMISSWEIIRFAEIGDIREIRIENRINRLKMDVDWIIGNWVEVMFEFIQIHESRWYRYRRHQFFIDPEIEYSPWRCHSLQLSLLLFSEWNVQKIQQLKCRLEEVIDIF